MKMGWIKANFHSLCVQNKQVEDSILVRAKGEGTLQIAATDFTVPKEEHGNLPLYYALMHLSSPNIPEPWTWELYNIALAIKLLFKNLNE
jgi:hypothetical protein